MRRGNYLRSTVKAVVVVLAVTRPTGTLAAAGAESSYSASSLDIGWDMTLRVRQRGGLGEIHRQRLREKLMATTGTVGAWKFRHNKMVQRQYNNLHRLLAEASPSSSCTFNQALVMECTLEDFCQGLAGHSVDNDRTSPSFACKGDLSQEWTIERQDVEVCYCYEIDESSSALPYDPALFNPDTDFCWIESSVVHMNQWDSVTLEQSLQVTRPYHHLYHETHDLHPCSGGSSNYDRLNITGGDYCKSCSSVQVDGVTCTSCSSCPTTFAQANITNQLQQVDCSNIHESFVSTCDDNEGSIAKKFVDYAGAECTFAGLFQGQCPMETYCARLNANRQDHHEQHQSVVTCYGDIHSDWVIKLRHDDEACFYMNDYHEHGKPYNATVFNPVTDYCIRTVLRIDLTGPQPVSEEYVYEITRPVEDHGVVREKSQLAPCAGEDDDVESTDYIFEKQGYCYQGCPEVIIGDKVCTSNCIICPDGYEALDCSNVDGALLESCSIDKDDSFVEGVVMYFDRQSVSKGNSIDTGIGIDDQTILDGLGELSGLTELTDKSASIMYGKVMFIALAVVALV